MKLLPQLFFLCFALLHVSFAAPTLSSSHAAQEEKPEAFLVHLKPKAGHAASSSAASKFLLLLRLPDGSTEAISTSSTTNTASETLSSEGSHNSNAVPEVEESSSHDSQSTQQVEDDGGFEEQQRDVSAPSSGYGDSDAQQKVTQHHAEDDAHDQQHHQQHDSQHKTPADVAQHELEHHTPQHHEVHTDSQQHEQTQSNSYPDEQKPLEQLRDNSASYGGSSAAHSAAAVTNYPANDERQVPVILIALPPEASPISQRLRLNKILGALGQSDAAHGTKGGSLKAHSAYSAPAAPLTDSYAKPASAAATKGGRANLAAAVKGGNVETHVHRDASHGGRPHVDVHVESPAAHPTGGFGGYGNSHTPSPAGGYGSLAMRLASKGIKAPTAKDVERPEQLKAILSPVQKGRLAATKGGKGTETHVHRDASGRPHVDVHVETPAAHPDGGSHSRRPAHGTKGGKGTETHVHRDASGRPHVDVHVETPAAHPDGGSHSRPAHGTKGGALSAPSSYSAPAAPLTDSYAKPASAAATKGGSSRLAAGTKGATTHVHRDASHGGRPHVDVHVESPAAHPVGGSKTLRQQVAQTPTKSLGRPSPAAIVKGRNRAAAAPAYSSSNNYPTRVEEQEVPRSVEEATQPVFDDEVDDGLPSKVVNSYESSAPVESPVSVPSSSSVDKKVEPSLQATQAKYAGKRLVLLLFNRGELDPAVAESAVEAAIARSGNF